MTGVTATVTKGLRIHHDSWCIYTYSIYLYMIFTYVYISYLEILVHDRCAVSLPASAEENPPPLGQIEGFQPTSRWSQAEKEEDSVIFRW